MKLQAGIRSLILGHETEQVLLRILIIRNRMPSLAINHCFTRSHAWLHMNDKSIETTLREQVTKVNNSEES